MPPMKRILVSAIVEVLWRDRIRVERRKTQTMINVNKCPSGTRSDKGVGPLYRELHFPWNELSSRCFAGYDLIFFKHYNRRIIL